jgi:Ni,Fe-hydrogenase I large subunit
MVETARGRLAHRVELAGERVRRYQVMAPTEWNFHPEGPLVCGLIGLETEDRETLRQHATMAVMALDPCVGYRVDVD